MTMTKAKTVALIKCDCGPTCTADQFVSYSTRGWVSKQAKAAGWRRKYRRGWGTFWFFGNHRGDWERDVKPRKERRPKRTQAAVAA